MAADKSHERAPAGSAVKFMYKPASVESGAKEK
jgi:hypothetical protein